LVLTFLRQLIWADHILGPWTAGSAGAAVTALIIMVRRSRSQPIQIKPEHTQR